MERSQNAARTPPQASATKRRRGLPTARLWTELASARPLLRAEMPSAPLTLTLTLPRLWKSEPIGQAIRQRPRGLPRQHRPCSRAGGSRPGLCSGRDAERRARPITPGHHASLQRTQLTARRRGFQQRPTLISSWSRRGPRLLTSVRLWRDASRQGGLSCGLIRTSVRGKRLASNDKGPKESCLPWCIRRRAHGSQGMRTSETKTTERPPSSTDGARRIRGDRCGRRASRPRFVDGGLICCRAVGSEGRPPGTATQGRTD